MTSIRLERRFAPVEGSPDSAALACSGISFTRAVSVETIAGVADVTGWRLRTGSADDSKSCRDIIAALPDYFTPDTYDKVTDDLVAHDSWVITDGDSVSGFAIVERRGPAAAEILRAAITPARRNQGIGTTLINGVLDKLRTDGTILVEVKTLDPSAGYPPYLATYRFWTTRAFIHIDTIDPLPGWEPGNPCAILVAPLALSR